VREPRRTAFAGEPTVRLETSPGRRGRAFLVVWLASSRTYLVGRTRSLFPRPPKRAGRLRRVLVLVLSWSLRGVCFRARIHAKGALSRRPKPRLSSVSHGFLDQREPTPSR